MTDMMTAEITEQEAELLNLLRREADEFELRITYRRGRFSIDLLDEGMSIESYAANTEEPFRVAGEKETFDDAWVDLCHEGLRAPPMPDDERTTIGHPPRSRPHLRLVSEREGR